MRLTCPNCEAQYEVPDEVIPPEGRDVQCSNCGDTWYQTSADLADTAPSHPTDTAVEQAVDNPVGQQADPDQDEQDTAQEQHSPPEEPESTPEPEFVPEPEAKPEPEPEADPVVSVQPEEQPSEEPLPDAPAQTGLARGMDPSVTGILREEAEREAQLRAAEGAKLESQPDLGLDFAPQDESSRRALQARDRMARMKGENPALLAATESGSRRGLLPDIEEINSTLRATGDPAAAPTVAPDAQHPPRRKSGFSRGFAIVVLLMLGLVMIYANAPQIAENLPQADPYLSSFVAWVDKARLWIDAQASGLQPAL